LLDHSQQFLFGYLLFDFRPIAIGIKPKLAHAVRYMGLLLINPTLCEFVVCRAAIRLAALPFRRGFYVIECMFVVGPYVLHLLVFWWLP
jgi:hypothetical protein